MTGFFYCQHDIFLFLWEEMSYFLFSEITFYFSLSHRSSLLFSSMIFLIFLLAEMPFFCSLTQSPDYPAKHQDSNNTFSWKRGQSHWRILWLTLFNYTFHPATPNFHIEQSPFLSQRLQTLISSSHSSFTTLMPINIQKVSAVSKVSGY